MAEHQPDRDLEFIDLFDTDTPDERRAAILAKLRESPEDYQRYEAYLEILDVPVTRKKDPPVHVHNNLLAAANQHIKEQRRTQARAWFSWLTHPALAGVAVLCGAFFLGQEFMSLDPGKPEPEIRKAADEDSLTATDNPIEALEALPEAEPSVESALAEPNEKAEPSVEIALAEPSEEAEPAAETALAEPREKARPEVVARFSDQSAQPARPPFAKPLPEGDASRTVQQMARKATTAKSAKLGQRSKRRARSRPRKERASSARKVVRKPSPSVNENPVSVDKTARSLTGRSNRKTNRPLRMGKKPSMQIEVSPDHPESELMLGSADEIMMAKSPDTVAGKGSLAPMADFADDPKIGARSKKPTLIGFVGNLEGFLSLIEQGNPMNSFTSKTLVRQSRLAVDAKRFKIARSCATIVLNRRDTFRTEAQNILDTLPK